MRNYLTVSIATALMLSANAWAADPGYHQLAEIKIAGDGGYDYLSVDSAARRLYVTHSTEVVVIDLDKNVVVGKVTGLTGLHGFALAPELGRGFATNGGAANVAIVDLKTLATIANVTTDTGPDAIAYDSGQQQVYAFNGRGHSSTVFDAKTGQVLATIALPGKPETGVVDPAAGRVYVNIEDASVVAVIDTKTHKLVEKWATAPCEAPVGMALDATNKRLLIGCDSQHLIMMDSTNGKVVNHVPIGEGIDAAAFDPTTKLAFTSNGDDGTVTIAHQDSPNKLSVVQTVKTAVGAHTMALDSKTHNIYLSVATRVPGDEAAGMGMGSAAAGMEVGGPPPRPNLVPGSFRVLVYGTGK